MYLNANDKMYLRERVQGPAHMKRGLVTACSVYNASFSTPSHGCVNILSTFPHSQSYSTPPFLKLVVIVCQSNIVHSLGFVARF